jgi:hypothetical protein
LEDKNLLILLCDQLHLDKKKIESKIDVYKELVQRNDLEISDCATMAFRSCLCQIQYINPEILLNYKGIHPLHEVSEGKPLSCDPRAEVSIPPELFEPDLVVEEDDEASVV